jgi:hypothetical protein
VLEVWDRFRFRPQGSPPPDGDALTYVRTAVLNGCRSVLRRRGIARRAGVTHRAGTADGTLASAEHEAILSENRREVPCPSYYESLTAPALP